MATHFYVAIFSPTEGGGYSVVFPDFPGCVTVGDDMEEAQSNAIEALCLHVEGLLEDGEALPDAAHINAPLPDWLVGEDFSQSVRVLVPIEVDSQVVRINVSLDSGLLARIDRVAQARGLSRSSALAAAAKQWMRAG